MATVSERMVRRGSTVRVRQRAFNIPCKTGRFVVKIDGGHLSADTFGHIFVERGSFDTSSPTRKATTLRRLSSEQSAVTLPGDGVTGGSCSAGEQGRRRASGPEGDHGSEVADELVDAPDAIAVECEQDEPPPA
jgi:hypothetical protein